jgi:hypothetical protein
LPDVVNQLLSGIAELQVDGAEFFRFGDIDGAFDELANGLFDLRSHLLHEGFDAFFAGWGHWGRALLGRHEATPGCEESM